MASRAKHVARMDPSRAVIATHNSYTLFVTRCEIKFFQITITRINDILTSPDVPALLVNPTSNPDSLKIEQIGTATSKNLGRRQNQDRVKKV